MTVIATIQSLHKDSTQGHTVFIDFFSNHMGTTDLWKYSFNFSTVCVFLVKMLHCCAEDAPPPH